MGVSDIRGIAFVIRLFTLSSHFIDRSDRWIYVVGKCVLEAYKRVDAHCPSLLNFMMWRDYYVGIAIP